MLLLWVATVSASPFTDADPTVAVTRPGVVLVDVPKAGACPADPWDTVRLPDGVTALRVDGRTQGDVIRALVGSGPYLPPMTLAWRDTAPVDRICGCVTPDELAAWMAGLAQGTTWADQLAQTLPAGGRPDTGTSLSVVERHYCAARYDAGFDVLKHVWDVIPAEAADQRDVRLARVARDMGVLARRSPVVTERIVAMRDTLEPKIRTNPEAQDDWVALNRVLLEDARTVKLWEDHRADPAWTRAIQHIGSSLFVLLTELDRWADASLVMPEPMVWLDSVRPAHGGLELALDGYAALLAAGRDNEAAPYARELLKLGPEGTGCRMVARALDADQPRKGHKALLKACDAALIARYEAALP